VLIQQAAKATEKDRGHRATHEEATRTALHPVLLHYAIAQYGSNGLRLLHVPLGFDEEALVVFSSWETARSYYLSRRHFLSEVFGEEWHARVCSAGELVSLLLGPYEGIRWVLLDPQPGMRFVQGSEQKPNLVSRERFLNRLLERAMPLP
jgi:hypothetical protein